uniref:Putative ovule protein n=1 Tax=Solanum chacoense TaxID=4108 RepID=A0A0V0GSH2_SOLCH
MAEIELKTAPADFRFPTTNQTRHCFTRYVEFHRCVAAKGDEAADCERFAKYYRALCPGEWVSHVLINLYFGVFKVIRYLVICGGSYFIPLLYRMTPSIPRVFFQKIQLIKLGIGALLAFENFTEV